MKKQGADVIGAKAGAKPKKPYIQKDTIGSTQNAEIVYGIGDGENGGLINGLNSIILDGTRVIGSSGEVNFNEVKYEERFGLIDQPPLKLIEDTITERGLNLEVRSAAPVVSSFNNKDVDKFVVRISVPSLMQNKDNGDSVAATISYAIDISVDGGAYQTVLEASATEKITNGYEFDHEIDAPVGTQRTIRVRRTTPDSTSQLLIDKFYVAAISEVINAKFSHPTLHYIGLVFNAEQFNNIPKAVFHYYGRKIKVPVNYNPTTRQYDGIWNGTFKVVYSNNPAWVLFDILTDRRSGLGRRIPVELVDKWELYRIAQYCDELVPDGEGGMEPRFVCNNLVLNSKQDAYQVLKDIASIFRGQSFWNGSQVVTVADAPRDIDYAISMASVISYSYSGTARNARHNVVKVQYYDKNNENSAAYEYATDYDSIRETEQINEVEIRAFGCTSAGQAQRLARYTLLSEQTETRILTAKLSMDAFVNMQIGDVFAWSDKFLAGANNGGRVVAVNGAELTLDRDVTDSALVGDTLFVNTTSGKASTRTITAINGNKVTLDAVMSTTEPEFVWVIDSAELSLLYFKLDDYKVNPAEGTVDIVGIQHVNGKFGTIDTETALEAPPFSKVEIETLRAPGNVITSFNVRVDQGLNIADLYVSWGQVKGATRYTVEFRRDSQAWRVLGNVTGLTHTIENVSAGIYEVRVRAADSIGNLSPYGFSAPINVAGIVLPPPKLASFSAVGKLLAIETKWAFPAGTEASLAVVIEHATQDPTNVGVPTQKLNIPYPQTEYVFNGLGANTQMWFRAAIVDKYGQEGEFTAWTTATADANPEELIDLISGHISESTLDQMLKGKIDGAGALAGEAQSLANQAQAAAANAATAAANAATKAQEAANAAAQEATDRAAAIAAQDTALKADATAKVAGLKAEIDPKITTLQNGITQVTTDYMAADTLVVGQINAYKTSNDNAVASVLQKAESAVSTGSTNSSAITAINGQISTINGALSTKLDASVISGYYTKGQTDAKAAEIAAGKVEEFSANLVIGGSNLLSNTATLSNTEETYKGGKIYRQYRTASETGAHDLAVNLFNLDAGDYTLSFDIKSSIDVPSELSNLSYFYNPNSTVKAVTSQGYTSNNPDGRIEKKITTTWQRIWITWTNSSAAPSKSLIINRAYGNGLDYSVDIANVKFEKGNKATDWTPSSADVENSINANSTAIQNTNAEVSRVDGVATAANNATTALSGRVSAVEGSVATKAEADALTALTTRVGNAEGVNTSQGSAITTLQNTVNHETTGLATKASTSALTATNSEVSRVNGVVTGHAGQLTQLAADITTINGNLATKADASALNDIYTKTQADDKSAEIAAGKIESYDANLVIGGTNLVMNTSEEKQGIYWVFVEPLTEELHPGIYTISYDLVNVSGASLSGSGVGFRDPIANTLKYVWYPNEETGHKTKTLQLDSYGFTHFVIYANSTVKIKNVKLERGSKATSWSPSVDDVQRSLDANSTAIQTTNAEVSRVDGRVTATNSNVDLLAGRIVTVENGLSVKADVTALNNIYTKAETDDKVTQIAAGEIQAFKSSLSIGGENLLLGTAEKSRPNKHKGYGVIEYVIQPWQMAVDAGYTTSHIIFDGEYYVLSFDAKSSVDGSSIRSYFYDPSNTISAETSQGYTSNAADGNVYFTLSTKWERYWVRWKQPLGVTSKQIIYARFDGQHGQSVTYQFARVKLETGTLATDYSLSGTEVDQALDANANAISETKTQVGNIEGTVSTHTSSLESLSSNLSNVSNTASQALVSASDALSLAQTTSNALSTETSRVDALTSRYAKLPKRNLVLGTNEVKQGATWHNFGRLAERIQGEITISFDCEKVNPSEADAGAGVGFNYGNGQNGGYEYVYFPVFGSGHFSRTLTVDSQSFTHFAIYSNNTVRIHNVMVTYGNTDEKWAIAPEELASKSDISVIYQTKADATSSSAAITSEVRSSLNASLYDNLIVNSDFSSGKLGWVSAPGYLDTMFDGVLNDNSGLGVDYNVRDGDSNTYYMHTSGTSQGYTEVYQDVSAKGSTQYQLSAYTAAHRTTSIIFAYFFNASNQIIGNSTTQEPNQQNNQEAWGGTSIENYKQCYINFITPPGCTTIRVVLRKTTGQATYVFATRFQLTEFIIPPNGPIAWSNGRAGGNTVVREQTRSVNGLMGSKVVTVDNNGVLSGYGLLSEVIEGRVTSSFGVNADTFFIGSPSLDKKPFVQKNDWSVINGVSVPPGTYIDTAFIANATIGLAHINKASIGSLSALSATIGLFRTAEYGRRTEISDSGFRMYNDAGIAVVELGDF